MSIFFTGFMGAGKSYFLNKMQKSNKSQGNCFFDLDDEILSFVNSGGNQKYLTLEGAIKSIGWEKFRELELKILKKFCSLSNDCLVSLGGGALNEESLKAIRESDSLLVWLNVDFETCLERARSEGGRPLLENSDSFLNELYQKRGELYRKADIFLSLNQINDIDTFDELKSIILK